MTALLAENSAVPAHDITFASLGVPAPLVSVLDGDGITVPFPVQAATLPDALAGRDILGRAKTGSGKTLGFSLPMVTRLAGGATAAGRPRGLVLVPTRELATQVQTVLTPLARAMGLRVATVYGGVSYRPQIQALQRGTDVLVACPGRLADLIGQGDCDLGDVEVTVIDEADQMADLGFLPIVRRLLEDTPDDGQRMLFSATLDSAIDVLARRFLNDPATHSVDENATPAEIEHHVITIDPADRLDVLAALAGGEKRSLVFTRTKHGAERLARQLTAAGIPAAELHGNLAQGARSRNLAAFGTGVVRVMVATDIASRGIHVDGVDLVIHADPPTEHKAYVHRSGRTARGGADGVVVTMQTAKQAREVRNLMRQAGVTPHQAEAAPDSEVLRDIAGPAVPRVTLTAKVTDLVRPEERLSERAGFGAGDGGRPRRQSRAERRAGAERRPDRPERSERPRSDRPARSERPRSERAPSDLTRPDRHADTHAELPAREERPARDERTAREERKGSDKRPAWSDRPARFDRPARSDRPARFDRSGRFGQAAGPARAERGPRFGDDGRPARGDGHARYEEQDRRPHDRSDRSDRFDRRDSFDRDRFGRRDRESFGHRDQDGFNRRGGDGFNRGAGDGFNRREGDGFNRREREQFGERDRGGYAQRSEGRFGQRGDRFNGRDRFNGGGQGSGREQGNGRDRFDRRDGFDRRDRFEGRERPARGESTWGERARNDSPAPNRAERTWADRPARNRGERPWNDRPERFDRAERTVGNDRPRGDWAPASRARGERAAGGRPPRDAGRPAHRGGSWGGTTARSGYSGSRTVPGKRGNTGQGRHS